MINQRQRGILMRLRRDNRAAGYLAQDEKVVSTPAAVESPVEEKKVELEGPPVVLNFQQFNRSLKLL